eukprot:3484054-Pleurochrysis_carterae.AAC.1
MEGLRGVATELDVLSAQGTPFARGVESARGAARVFKERRAVVYGGRFSGRRTGTVAGVSGASVFMIELLRAFGAVSVPVLAATVPTDPETRRPFLVEGVRPLGSFRVAFLERLVDLLACTVVRLSEEGA